MANGIQGLLGSGSLTDLGLGLLAASGPVVGRPAPSLGQALGQASVFASNRGTQRLENEFARERLRRLQQRREAANQLQGLLGNQTTIQGQSEPVTGMGGESLGLIPGMKARVPEIATPGGQNQLLGLLGRIAPEQVASSLLSQRQERSEPADIREFRTFFPNVNPGTPEGREKFLEFQAQKGANSDQLGVIDARLKLLELEAKQNEIAEQNRTQSQQRQAVADNFVNTLKRSKDLLKANDTLEDTFLETGRADPGNFREFLYTAGSEIKKAFGDDTQTADRLITARNTFKKNASGFAIDLIANLENATNQKFEVLRNSIANLGVDPDTNRKIIADTLRRSLQIADRHNVDIPQSARSDAEELINSIEGVETNTLPKGRKRLKFNPDTGQLEEA